MQGLFTDAKNWCKQMMWQHENTKKFIEDMDKEIEDKTQQYNKDAELEDVDAPIHDYDYYDLKIKLKILECLNELTSKVKDVL